MFSVGKVILDVLNPPSKPYEIRWRYQYPQIDGEVRNNAVSRFQSGIVNLAFTNENKMIVDLKRNYQLNGKFYHPDTEQDVVLNDISNFVDKAFAYQVTQRDALKKYLTTRGGQDHNFLIQDLIASNHFLDSSRQCLSSNYQHFVRADWKINLQGKIVLRYTTDILSIEYLNPVTKEIKTFISDNYDGLESYSQESEVLHQKRKNGLNPLMRINFTIRLEMNNGVVIPVVADINVEGFNDAVQMHPLNFINSDDIRQDDFAQINILLDAAMRHFKDCQVIQQVLTDLRYLLSQSINGENLEPVALAAQYLDKINWHFNGGFFSDSEVLSMRELNDNYEPLPLVNRNESLSFALRKYNVNFKGYISNIGYSKSSIEGIFGKLYDSFKRVLQYYNPVASYKYNVSDEGIIDGEFFKEWQLEAASSNLHSNIHYENFRNSKCRVLAAHLDHSASNNDIKSAVYSLTDQLNKASDDDKQKLASWILCNGESLHFSMVKLLIAKEISAVAPKSMSTPSIITKFNPACIEWRINLEGNIEFTSVYYMTGLIIENSNLKGFRDIRSNNLVYKRTTDHSSSQPPVMRIEIKSELNISNGIVIPKVKSLEITSYCNQVKPKRAQPCMSVAYASDGGVYGKIR
ncbi:MAG TPA: hypothetical protein VL360_02170 [Gammaproteobacteria bacterium]|nr:hypothetical protein [Gammaproteobacteria bacterium]